MPLPLNIKTGQIVSQDQREATRRQIKQQGLGNYRTVDIAEVHFEPVKADEADAWEIVLTLRLGTTYKPFRA